MKRIAITVAAAVAALIVAARARADFQSLASPGPLARAHAAFEQSCDKCHVPFKGIPATQCLACHAATQKRIASGIGTHAAFARDNQKCSSCHKDHKGRAHELSPPVDTRGFDHAARTGVALAGKHAQVACASCHVKGPNGPRWIDIRGLDDCGGCHKDAHAGKLGASCKSCHAPAAWKPATKSIADHLVPMTGGHAGLPCEQCHTRGAHLVETSSCGDCHEQKHGGTKAPCKTCHNVNDWKSATFQHDFCSCILPGKHQTAPCLSCHPAFRFKPTPFACAACHEKERKHDDLGPCSRCHSALSWKTRTFDHNQPRVGFAITGKHTEVGCENCHTQKGVFKGAPRACEGCHKVPKHGDFGPCAKCHDVATFAKQRFSHDDTRFPLDGHHAQKSVRCESCHARFKKGEFTPGPNACALCHGDPHGGQFSKHASRWQLGKYLLAQTGTQMSAPHTFSPRFGCKDCHTTQAWVPSTIDPARHAADFKFALAGQHAALACTSCHAAGRFVDTPRACASCHVDRHGGRFGGDCARCHDESGWRHHPGFDHALTGFVLTGAHSGVACAQCHGPDRQRLRPFAGKVGCATCHTPRHGDQFGRDCTRCHQPTRFSDVPPFDHAQTLFPLDRRHRAVRCTTCHDAARAPHLDPNCRTCHGDPHRGRALLDCGECHRADVWRVVRFDHDRSEFPLRGRHFTTPCRDCHVNDQFTGVRTECVNCHRGDRQRADSLHADHRGFGFDCSECHRSFSW